MLLFNDPVQLLANIRVQSLYHSDEYLNSNACTLIDQNKLYLFAQQINFSNMMTINVVQLTQRSLLVQMVNGLRSQMSKRCSRRQQGYGNPCALCKSHSVHEANVDVAIPSVGSRPALELGQDGHRIPCRTYSQHCSTSTNHVLTDHWQTTDK